MPITKKNKEDIKEQIAIISKQITLKKTNIKFNQLKLNSIINNYEYLRDSIKTFMKKEHETQIDRHKVAAIMSIAILKNEPIEIIGDKSSATAKERSANIILTFLISLAIIEDFYAQENTERIKINTSTTYIQEYTKLIENNLINLQSVWVNPKQDLSNIVFFISHIFYFLEENTKLQNKTIEKPTE